MKFALVFLISVLVVSTHQYFYGGHSGIYWQSPYSPQPFIDIRQPFIVQFSKPTRPTIHSLQSKNPVTNYIDADDSQVRNSYGEPYTFPDTELRFKGLNRNQPSNEQQDARFLFSKDGVYTNPFLKTVTFTTRTSLSLTFFVTCVPSNQVQEGANATPCRRKRSTNNVTADAIAEGNQFIIAPSETQKLTTTAVFSSSRNLYQLSSSKDDTSPEEILAEDPSQLRKQRFLFANKNLFIISSTVTSYSFSNATVTVTKSLLNIGNDIICKPLAAAENDVQCVTCLPSGYAVCNAAG